MKHWLIVVLSFCVSGLFGQNEIWLKGAVVLATDDVVTGEIFFIPAHDMLVLRQADARFVITGPEVKSFQFYDSLQRINRKFISVADHEYRIFEVVLSGMIEVLRKGKHPTDQVPEDRVGYQYYFVMEGVFYKPTEFRRKIFPQIKPYLTDDLKIHHLDPNSRADAIQLVAIYNRLFLHQAMAGR